ncbi:MAG: glycosyltransferase family 4 protein [Chloroflexi bacterium]|nr:glycosyltransferase family 4 protein [Chloroflexota bacterium]
MTARSTRPALPAWKIALVSPYDFPYPGGVTEHVASLAEQFRRLGQEVHVIAPSSADPETVQAIPSLHRIGHVVPIPANGSVARIALSLRGYGQVKELLQRERFDVVHLHEPLMPALPLTVLRHSHALNIATFHAFRRSNLMYFYGKPLLQPFFARLDGLIAVSRPARDFVAEHFPGDYRVIPNGIDYAYFSAPRPRRPAFDDGKLNVLFVGRLEKRKGLKYLLRAWPRVRAACGNVRLIVVGGGRPLSSYRRLAACRGWEDVVFTGHVSREELAQYYHTCDVFCAPSTGHESFGIVLLEAMAAGKPIVTTDIPGYCEVVTHGQQALLAPPQDERALAEALCQALANPELRCRLGRTGARTARRYSWDKVAVQVLDFYGEVMERKASTVAQASGRVGRVRRAAADVAHLLAR